MAVQTPIPLFFFLALSIALPILSADPDPLQDFCVADLKRTPSLNGFPCKPASKVTSKDFFFRGLVHSGNTSNMYGSKVAPANVLTFTAVNTLGISMNRVDLAASGGINPPHSHPRAAEIGVVIQGEVAVGFVTTAGEYYSEVLRRKGEVFVVPRGMVHFQLNVGKTKAILFTAFNSQLPGAVIIPTNLFGSTPLISNQVLTRAFKINETVVDLIKSRLSV